MSASDSFMWSAGPALLAPGTSAGSSGLMGSSAGGVPLLRMRLLGGFYVEQADVARAVSNWGRRSAKTLTKLLAICPRHTLHREQVLDILWPDADPGSALNSFGKALHAARHVFEPDLPPRKDSAYLRLTETMVGLNSEHVEIDVDGFERLADQALRTREITAYESALAAYGGELLPEDRYAQWCAERRGGLADLHVRLLLGLADVLEQRGAFNAAADRLRTALSQDPTQEFVHRRLMRLYAEMGIPDQAVRQFHLCKDVLRRELELDPQPETVSLYQDILGNRAPRRGLTVDGPLSVAGRVHRPVTPAQEQAPVEPASRRPFVGRERVIRHLCGQLARGADKQAGMMLVTGEPGVGKTRLLEEFATRAGGQGAAVLWSGRGGHAPQFACGPFAVALDGYLASLPERERSELSRHYPALARFVPSLRPDDGVAVAAACPGDYYLDLMPAIARLLTGLGRRQPVLIVLGDLHDADQFSIDLLCYLTHLAVREPWLLVGAVRDEQIGTDARLRQMIQVMLRERLCLRIGLRCLPRRDCDDLVRALFPEAQIGDHLLEQLYTSSRGNPLLVEEIVREIQDRGGAIATQDCENELSRGVMPVPTRLRTLASMRLAAMDETVRNLLGLAAASRTTEISLAELRAAAAALEPPVCDAALFDALDRALDMSILEEREAGYAFRHPLFRSAIDEAFSRHRREQFHAALAASPPRVDRRRHAIGTAGLHGARSMPAGVRSQHGPGASPLSGLSCREHERKRAGIGLMHAC